MLILGLNTRLEVGNRKDGHDPAAAVFKDGRLVYAVEEERFSRVRYAAGQFPRQAVAWCLNELGVGLDDIDVVALGWNPRLQADFEGPKSDQDILEQMLPKALFPRSRDLRIEFVDHHRAHAAGAFYSSPFDSAAVLVVDGAGENESISWHRAGANGIQRLGGMPVTHSLGFFYQAVSKFVGLGSMGAGKTMGLAAYGKDRFRFCSPIDDPIVPATSTPTLEHNELVVASWVDHFASCADLSPNRDVPSWSPRTARASWVPASIGQDYRDVAASAQAQLERDLIGLAQVALRDSGEQRLAIAGGVGLNCSANGVLQKALGDVLVYVQPAANDAGVAIGAAAHICAQAGLSPVIARDHVYSGPRFERAQIADLLTEWGIRFAELSDPVSDAAQELAAGKVLAWFHGRAELGPRALGSRSLLASPRNDAMRDLMNSVKKREQWRPLAPSVPEELAPLMFSDSLDRESFAHMLMTATVDGPLADRVKAVVHIDGTTRPQVLTEADNPEYHRLLMSFYRETGIPALVDTSFNVSEPMVNNPAEAVRTFMTSPIDQLVIEGLTLSK